jgi:hypothetical protein
MKPRKHGVIASLLIPIDDSGLLGDIDLDRAMVIKGAKQR